MSLSPDHRTIQNDRVGGMQTICVRDITKQNKSPSRSEYEQVSEKSCS